MSEKQVESVPFSSKQEGAGGPPAAYAQQPAAYAQQPGVYAQQPGAYAQQPGAYAQQPVVYTQQAVAPPGGVPPNDYFVMSILTLLFCFWPLGIVALIKSIEVRSAVARGDYTAAQAASKSAYQHNKLAIIIGIVVLVFVGLSQLVWIIQLAV